MTKNPTPAGNGHGAEDGEATVLSGYFWLHVKDDGSEWFAGRDFAPGLMRGRGVLEIHSAYNGFIEDTFTLITGDEVYPRPRGADWAFMGREIVPAGRVNAGVRFARWRRIRRQPLRFDDPTLLEPGRWLA